MLPVFFLTFGGAMGTQKTISLSSVQIPKFVFMCFPNLFALVRLLLGIVFGVRVELIVDKHLSSYAEWVCVIQHTPWYGAVECDSPK